MIEKSILTYLKTKLDVPVYMGEIPANRPQSFVVIKAIDGGRINMIDAITFNIYSYATSLVKAAELNEVVKAAMYGAVEVPEISSSRCGGGGQSINTTTKEYAYECIFNLFYME